MLSRLSLRLDGEVNFRRTSLLQGVMMERLDEEYAAYLHRGEMNPYSQYVTPAEEGGTWWVINTLNQSAYDNIIEKFLTGKDEIVLQHGGERKLKVTVQSYR